MVRLWLRQISNHHVGVADCFYLKIEIQEVLVTTRRFVYAEELHVMTYVF